MDKNEMSGNRTEHDVMISYKGEDAEVANRMRDHLEKAGIRCWIAPSSVQPGENYEVAIGSAIKQCVAVVLVFSSATEKSRDVKQEMSLAFHLDKHIIPFRIDRTEPNELAYVLVNKHWLEAIPPGPEHFVRLEERLGTLLNRRAPASQKLSRIKTVRERLRKVPGWSVAVLVLLIVLPIAYLTLIPWMVNKSLSKGWGSRSLNKVYARACGYQDAWYLRDKSIATYWRVMAYQSQNYDEWRKDVNSVRVEKLRLEYQEALRRKDTGVKQDDLLYQWAHFMRVTGHFEEAMEVLQDLQGRFPDSNWSQGICYYLARHFRSIGDGDRFADQKARLMTFSVNDEVFDFERGFLITVREAILHLSITTHILAINMTGKDHR